jgi:dethiobiotin synthetase
VSAFFVTATGTEIGKTYVIENMINRWSREALDIRVLKPVISGFDPQNSASSDTCRLLKAMGETLSRAEINAISPWRFAAPLSPDMAAALENKHIPFDDVVAFCRKEIAQAERNSTTLLIEGIGGVMVPLDQNHSVLDWIVELNIPAILVCGSYLGSLSHTLTAVSVLQYRGISIDRIIVNESPESEVELTSVRECLSRFVQEIPIEMLPFEAPPCATS